MADTQNKDVQIILDLKVNYEKAVVEVAKLSKSIDDLTESKRELEKQNKSLRDSDKKDSAELMENQKQIENLNVEITKEKTERRELQKEIQNSIKQRKEDGTSLRALRAELSNVTKAFDSLSKKEREGTLGTEFKDRINDITKQLKEAEGETQRYYRNVGNYEQSIINAITGNNGFASSLAGIAQEGGGIKGFFQGAITQVKGFGAALMGLMANPVFIGLAGIVGAGASFKWFVDYNTGLIEATRLTQQFTQLSGRELQQYRDDVQAVADAYGYDFREMLVATNALAKGFGISMSESLQLIQDGLVSGADANGEFLDTLKEYPAYFREAGISAEGFVAITTQAVQQGIFSDKGVDTIKEANLRLREMTKATSDALNGIGMSSEKVQQELQSGSKTTFQIMQEIAAKLKEFPQTSAVVGTAIADIFGGPGEDAGLAYIESLATIKTGMEDVKGAAGEIAKAQEQEVEAQKELNNAMSAMFDFTGGGFERIKADLTTIGTKLLTAIIKGLGSAVNWFVKLYNSSVILRSGVASVVTTFKVLWSAIKLVFNLIVDGFKNVGRGLELFVRTTKNAFGAITGAAEGFGKILAGIANFSLEEIEQGVGKIRNSIVGGFKNSLKDLGNTIKSGGGEVINDVMDFGKDVGNAFRDGIEQTTWGVLNGIDFSKVAIDDANAVVGGGGKGGGGNGNNGTPDPIKQGEKDLKKIVEQNAKVNKITEDEIKKRIELENKKYALLIEAAGKGTQELYDLQLKKLENEKRLAEIEINETIKDENQRNEMILANDAAFNARRMELQSKFLQEQRDAQKQAILDQFQEDILTAELGGNELEVLRLQMEQRKKILETAQQQEGESIQQFNIRRLQMEKDYQESKKNLDAKEMEIQQGKLQSYAALANGLGSVFEAMGEENEDFVKLSKALALAEIAINIGAAIAKMTSAESTKGVVGIATTAAGIASILAQMAAAIKLVNSAKFASGGLIQGYGSGTSDSITARVSNGESINTAQATALFSPLLSAINQMGGGVPIVATNSQQQIGEDMLANAFARGAAMMPRPVVSVEEINATNQRIEVLERLATMQ